MALRDALKSATPAAISTAQTALIANENQLVSALSEHGGLQTRIEAAQSQQRDRAGNLESLVSGETDIPLLSEV